MSHLTCRWWSPGHLDSALDILDSEERSVLRLAATDPLLVTPVLDSVWAIDRLHSPASRMQTLIPYFDPESILAAEAALWVHWGDGKPPQHLTIVSPERHGRSAHLTMWRSAIPDSDITQISGRWVTSEARSVADVVRTTPLAVSVPVLLHAHAHGVDDVAILVALSHCRGPASSGRLQAARLVRTVYSQAG